ncbi:MAG: alkaline phosphatase family protein [Acidimicrobiia bacterium]|nr:alkaline phosphatase family protein [Acidimicrobiia bacterium]
MRRVVGRVVVALCVFALAVAASVSPGAASVAPKAKKAPQTGHVFVINLENTGFETTFGSASPAPYLSKELTAKGQLLTQYYGVSHASLGNYLAQISGQGPSKATQVDCPTFSEFETTGTGELDQVLGDGCVYPASVQTIADQLTAKRLTWRGYMEDIGNSATEPTTCRHPAIGEGDPTQAARTGDQYATKHNPFVYFHSIIDSPLCAKNVVGLDRLSPDLASVKKTPNLVYIAPNLCNDGHDEPCVDGKPGGLVSADAFLKQWVPKILKSPAFKKDGMLIVTFDEAELTEDSSECCGPTPAPNVTQAGLNGPGGGRIGAVIISKFVKPGTTNDTPYNHYALLCSMEDLFGLSHLGLAGRPGLACFGPDVYNAKG